MEMKSLQIFAMVISLLVFVTGCRTPRNEAALFRHKYPEQAKHYYVLEPQSVHALIDMMYMHQQTILGILDGVERRKGRPEALEEYLRQKRELYSETNFLPAYAVIKGTLEEVGGTLYYFKWRYREFNRTYEDEGFMIIRGGKIIYRNGKLTEDFEKSHNQGNALDKQSPGSCVPPKESTSAAQ